MHDVHEQVDVLEEVPFVPLDSLEAIDSRQIARPIEYVESRVEYLVVAPRRYSPVRNSSRRIRIRSRRSTVGSPNSSDLYGPVDVGDSWTK